jgi:serine/threonine protein kinase
MELRNPRFKEFTKLVCDTLQPRPDFRVMCTAAIGVADCFRKLHISGLAYKDINLGGPFLDPRTGEILICDCDNVRVNNTPGTIMFLGFAAPEVVVGKSSCTNRTDDHSLAVLMFYMFVRDHPLEGEQEAKLHTFNDAAKRKLYGENPVFIFDPTNDSNRPVRGTHSAALHNWPRMPKFIQDAFTRAFTEGLHDPNRRLRDNEWISLFSKLRDGLFTCPSCGQETLFDQDVVNSDRAMECFWCRSRLQTPMRLRVGNEVLSISPEMHIYPHHLGEFYNFNAPVAKMSRHPKDPNKWGIKNLTENKWTFSGADGLLKEVPPGRSMPLRKNIEINFGTVRGIIQV